MAEGLSLKENIAWNSMGSIVRLGCNYLITIAVVRLSHGPSGVAVKVGESRSREDNRWLARRMLAETILDNEHKRKSAARQKAEKIRRQKRRRSRRQKQKMLADKHAHSEIKAMRKKVEVE